MSKISKVRIRRRGHTYSYAFETGIVNGVRKRCEKGGFLDADSAYAAGVAAYNDWKHGNIGITTPGVSVAGFLQSWMDNACKVSVKDTTWYLYGSMIRTHIMPSLGNIVLQELSPAILDRWIQRMVMDGMAYKSISLVLAILRRALNYAVYPGQLIQSNPAAYVKVPRTAPKNIVKRTIVSRERMNGLMEKFPLGHPARIPILLLYHTGMRIGEVIGLCWDDINLQDGIINVRRQLRYISDLHGHYFRSPKTQAGTRSLYIGTPLIEELTAWKALQAENEVLGGDSYIVNFRCTEGDSRDKDRLMRQSKGLPIGYGLVREYLVCTKQDGSLVTPDVMRWQLRQEGLNSHSFRHTQATVLIENGATPKGVAGRLGQASVLLTQDLYTHDTQKLRKDTAAIFYHTQDADE